MRDLCTVVVCSCDAYSDLAGHFSVLFRKYWPDCPFDTVLVTETRPENASSFSRVMAFGKGGNWCDRLVKALDGISTPYVFMLCDDYLLSSPVDTAGVLSRLEQIRSLDGVNLRMIPNPQLRRSNSFPVEGANPPLFAYRKDTAYCIATQAGFWNREFLRNLAEGKSSIWEFERYGSFSVGDESRPILVVPEKEFPFVDAVHKGHWEKFGLALCRENSIEVDLKRRALPPLSARFKEFLKSLVFAAVPNTLIVKVQNALSLGAKEKGGRKGF